ncbi:hypothetical protein CsSME_00031529 [Camellia sinensis var. sinensis]
MIYIIDCFTGFEKLGELTSLKSLNLTSNRLEGTIHINDLKGLNNLEQLDISHNQFDGFITHSGFERLFVLGKLELLRLDWNSFNNSILPSLGVLSSLKTLSIFGNRLNGSIDIGGKSSIKCFTYSQLKQPFQHQYGQSSQHQCKFYGLFLLDKL